MKRKTPGQIAYEASWNPWDRLHEATQSEWEAAASAVLADQWRPVTEPPEDQSREVIMGGGGLGICELEFDRSSEKRTHWMPIPPLPPVTKPSPYAERIAKLESEIATLKADYEKAQH